jgi:hypothetical protein
MTILGIIASSFAQGSFVQNFTQETNLPLTSTFGTIANGFTEGYVYWGGGRDQSATNFYSFYSRTVASQTWTYQNSKNQIGQFRASAYPVGSTNKWLQNGGEYGGALNTSESMVYGGSWTNETSYPISIHYNGMGVIRNTKVAYSIAGSQPGSVYITSVYSYTGTGSWSAQTAYPTNADTIQYKVVSLPTKVVVCGGANASGDLSAVYSYTGSGSWTLENNLPSDLKTNSYYATYVYNPDTSKVYAITNQTTNFYYWTGSGAWTLGGIRNSYSQSGYPKNIAAVGTSIFALGGDYRNGSATCYRAVVR